MNIGLMKNHIIILTPHRPSLTHLQLHQSPDVVGLDGPSQSAREVDTFVQGLEFEEGHEPKQVVETVLNGSAGDRPSGGE